MPLGQKVLTFRGLSIRAKSAYMYIQVIKVADVLSLGIMCHWGKLLVLSKLSRVQIMR